jgi:hypothetical protein
MEKMPKFRKQPKESRKLYHDIAIAKFLASGKEKRKLFIEKLRQNSSTKDLGQHEMIQELIQESIKSIDNCNNYARIEDSLDWSQFLGTEEYFELYMEIESSLRQEILQFEEEHIEYEEPTMKYSDSMDIEEEIYFDSELIDHFQIESFLCPFCR